ncbi:MAG TPA: tetratricopeptide repeat protein, partial [Caulobacteraceae bacterium]|nr:tetratricopeptide repeat protein [Caulobacteraceae bacterium]
MERATTPGKIQKRFQRVVDQAIQLRTERRYDEALKLLRDLFLEPVFPISPNRLRRAYALAMTCADKLSAWSALEALAREAIERVPEPSHAYYRLGEALMRQDRLADAEAALQTAIELNPAEQEAPMLLQLCRSRSQAPSKRPRVAPWPGRQT